MIRLVVPFLVVCAVFLTEAESPLEAAAAASEMSVILSNGPTASRINVALLAEGYRDVESAKFYADARTVVTSLLAAEPLRSYARFYNAFAIFVASEESGSSHTNPPIARRTYFNSTFDSYGIQRLLTLPPNNLNSRYADGQGKAIDLLKQWLPDYDLAVVVVNDPTYGGSGGPILVVSTHSLSGQIAVHEQGHTFAALGDEYADPFPGYPDIEEPNTTRETQRDRIKWRTWIDPATPLPTPTNNTLYARAVGLFEGAHYHSVGWFRPRLDCRMRSLGSPFCQVCAEAIDLSLHRALGTMDSSTPATNLPVVVSIFGSGEFVLSPVLPAGAGASVSWSLDDVAMATDDPFRLLLPGSALARPTSQLVARYTLESPFVRTDPNHLMEGVVQWTITRDMQKPPALAWGWDKGGGLFLAWPVAAEGFQLETTTDVVSGKWTIASGSPIRAVDQWQQAFPLSQAGAYFRLRRP
ncbi:MAG: hypothetical protein HY299_09310 [Verrucomicrobia bacterium]|nr:hypothetical protein [Verrucomicrobiota bacterium]